MTRQARKIKPPRDGFWRTIDPNGYTKSFQTREEAGEAGREIANSFNGSVLIEEWSSDHPQDEINDGWALVEVKYAPGKEPKPRPGRRTSAQDIPVGSEAEVYGFEDQGAWLNGEGRYFKGSVKEVRRTRHPILGVAVVFDDDRQALAVEYAVAHVLKEVEK